MRMCELPVWRATGSAVLRFDATCVASRVVSAFSHTICDRTGGARGPPLGSARARGRRRGVAPRRVSLSTVPGSWLVRYVLSPQGAVPPVTSAVCVSRVPRVRVYFTRAAAVRSSARPVSRSVRLMLFRGAASTIVTRSLHSRVCRLARISCLAGSGRVHGGRVRCRRCRRSRVGGRARGRDHAFYLLHLLCPIGFSSWGRALGLISVDSSRTTTTTTW